MIKLGFKATFLNPNEVEGFSDHSTRSNVLPDIIEEVQRPILQHETSWLQNLLSVDDSIRDLSTRNILRQVIE